MNTVRILKYELRDVLRSRALIVYTVFFLCATELLIQFGGGGDRALMSLGSVVLLVVPLVGLVLGMMFVYNAREFSELLLSQPVSRRQLFGGLYLAFLLPLAAGLTVGAGIPLALHGAGNGRSGTAILLLVIGLLLTGIFTALAFAIAIRVTDRVRGIGLGLLTWILLALAWDALVLAGVNAFHAWPLERPLLLLMMLNPIDLARVLLMLEFDVSALMGYTGAVFQDFFGGRLGLAVALTALFVWWLVPVAAGARALEKKDF